MLFVRQQLQFNVGVDGVLARQAHALYHRHTDRVLLVVVLETELKFAQFEFADRRIVLVKSTGRGVVGAAGVLRIATCGFVVLRRHFLAIAFALRLIRLLWWTLRASRTRRLFQII